MVVSAILIVHISMFTDILQNFSRMIEKYGSCFKFVGLNRVGLLVADASVTEAVLKSPNLHHVNKNIVYDVMKPFITNGILVSKGDASLNLY